MDWAKTTAKRDEKFWDMVRLILDILRYSVIPPMSLRSWQQSKSHWCHPGPVRYRYIRTRSSSIPGNGAIVSSPPNRHGTPQAQRNWAHLWGTGNQFHKKDASQVPYFKGKIHTGNTFIYSNVAEPRKWLTNCSRVTRQCVSDTARRSTRH